MKGMNKPRRRTGTPVCDDDQVEWLDDDAIGELCFVRGDVVLNEEIADSAPEGRKPLELLLHGGDFDFFFRLSSHPP